MNKSALFGLKLDPFQTFRAWPFINGITSSLKPLQVLYTP